MSATTGVVSAVTNSVKDKQCNFCEVWLASPRSFALFFAGASFHQAFLDPYVLKELPSVKQKVTHWTKLYRLGLVTMPIFAGLGSIAGFAQYVIRKEPLWAIGAGVLLSIFPFTFIFMMPTNHELEALNEKKEENCSVNDLERGEKLISKWYKLHTVRFVLSLVAAGIFFAAEIVTKRKA